MPKKYKWRLVLSLCSLAVAFALSVWGWHEANSLFEIQRRHDNALAYIPRMQVIGYCLNAPAFVFANLMGNTSPWKRLWNDRWLGGHVFHGVNVSFFPAVFLLWWCIGWHFDVKVDPCAQTGRAVAAILGNSLGTGLSLVLLWVSMDLVESRSALQFAGTLAIPIACMVWGGALFCHFGWGIYRLGRA